MPNVLCSCRAPASGDRAEAEGRQGPGKGLEHGEYNGQCIKDLVVADGQKGQLTPEQYDQAARDISAFLQYVRRAGPDPARELRACGCCCFLVAFSFLAYLLKHEYWRRRTLRRTMARAAGASGVGDRRSTGRGGRQHGCESALRNALTLFSGARCVVCHRVRLVLAAKGVTTT